MFSKELEALIKASLEDGVLEDYEKAAIVKRAKSEGVDLTELEIYINSILQKRKREHDLAEDAKQEKIDQRKREAFGKVCPNCGKQVPPMTLKCECGYEFIKKSSVSSAQKLQDKIANISAREEDEKDKIADMLNAISLFPVPNTKEDIIEFLALAISKSNIRGGLWGTTGGRAIIFFISCLIVVVLCVILGFCTHDMEEWLTTCAVVIFFSFIFVLPIMSWGFQDIINSNRLAIAWREKFQQVMIKARSLRGDAEFTQQLDYYESLLED